MILSLQYAVVLIKEIPQDEKRGMLATPRVSSRIKCDAFCQMPMLVIQSDIWRIRALYSDICDNIFSCIIAHAGL